MRERVCVCERCEEERQRQGEIDRCVRVLREMLRWTPHYLNYSK